MRIGALSEVLLKLGVQLEINEIPDSTWGPAVRGLRLVHALNDRRLIAVAGVQGAGKTHLMRNLYPEAADWLRGNLVRGETNPVVIQERADCTAPYGVIVRRRQWRPGLQDEAFAQGLLYETEYGPDQRADWQSAVRSTATDIVLIELNVPQGFIGADGAGFVLLPGFERAVTADWQKLMRVVLATSPAAVIVAGPNDLAGAATKTVLQHLAAEAGGTIDFAVVVSHCEGTDPQEIEELLESARESFGVRREDIVAAGDTRDDPESWAERLRDAVARIYGASAAYRTEATLLRELVNHQVPKTIQLASDAIARSKAEEPNESGVDRLMGLFDESSTALRRSLGHTLKVALDNHAETARTRLAEELRKSPRSEIFRRVEDWFGTLPDEASERIADLVNTAWQPNQALREIQGAVQNAVDQHWQTYGEPYAQELTKREEPMPAGGIVRDLGVVPALRAFPGAALEARLMALRLTASPAAVDSGSGRSLQTVLQEVGEDHRLMLVALNDLVSGRLPGTGEAPTGYLDVAKNLKASAATVQRLLTGAGTVAVAGASAGKVAAVGGTAAGTATAAGTVAAGEAAGAGAGVIASTTVAVALTATLVVSVTAMTVHLSFRVIKDRNAVARHMLTTQRNTTEQRVLESVDRVLETVRDITRQRLREWLGTTDAEERRARLEHAVAEVRRARDRTLEALDDRLA